MQHKQEMPDVMFTGVLGGTVGQILIPGSEYIALQNVVSPQIGGFCMLHVQNKKNKQTIR